MAFYRINLKRRVIEIHFDEAPDEEVKEKLRANRWHYQKTEGRWSKEITDANIEFAEEICTAKRKDVYHIKNDLKLASKDIIAMKDYKKGDSVFINNQGVDISFSGAKLEYDENGNYGDFLFAFNIQSTTKKEVKFEVEEVQINGFIAEFDFDEFRMCNGIATRIFKASKDNMEKLDIMNKDQFHLIKMQLAFYIDGELIREKGISLDLSSIEEVHKEL